MNELQGVRAAIAVPSYGPVDPRCAKSLRVAMAHAANRGLVWVGDISVDRMGWAAARNTIAQAALDSEIDGLVWFDSDIMLAPDTISRLVDDSIRTPADFVSGIYHQRAPFHNPVFYHYDPERAIFQPAEDYTLNAIFPAGGCGFGCVWTSAALLQAIAAHPDFTPKGGWFPDKRDVGGFGEDLAFCDLARKAGFRLWVDSGIQVGHVGDGHIVTREDFLRERPRITGADIEAGTRGWGLH